MWLVENDPPALPSFDSTGKAYVDLVLKSSDEDTTRIWPHWYSNCDYFTNLFFSYFRFLNNCYCSCFSFEFHLRVSLGLDGNLTLISRVRNINSKPFSFSIAYHTYFSISDIRFKHQVSLSSLLSLRSSHLLNAFFLSFFGYFISEVRVEGLETLDYLDNMLDKERFTEQGDALTFESEIDRVYLNSKDVVAVFDHERKRTFLIEKEGLPDVGKILKP